MAPNGERHPKEQAEVRRARITILSGLAAWLVLAVVVDVAYGLPASVLIGWGGSMIMCLGVIIGPLAADRVRRARQPKPRPIGSADVRDGAVAA